MVSAKLRPLAVVGSGGGACATIDVGVDDIEIYNKQGITTSSVYWNKARILPFIIIQNRFFPIEFIGNLL
jgi:hypothetical protein